MQPIRTNLTNNASSLYTNFDYNSLCRFNGLIIGAKATGLFKARTGTTDNGTAIAAYFVTYLADFGDIREKQARRVYVGWQCSGSMTVTFTGDEQTTIGPYTLTATSGKGQHVSKADMSMLLHWTHGSFKFSNVSGSDFAIDDVKVLSGHKKLTLHQVLNGCSGWNNIVDPVRLKYDPKTGISELAEAVNVDIDDTGRVSRRFGQTIISALNYHSAYCDKGDCFVVEDRTSDAAIYKVSTTYALAGVRSALTKGARIAFKQVGVKTYYTSAYQNGVIEGGVSYGWPDHTYHVGATTVRVFFPAPLGTHLEVFQSCMWIAEGKVIWVSEPHAFGKYDKTRRFFQFASNVRMMKAVAGGVWVSDNGKTGFIAAGNKFEDMRYDQKSPFPAHEWSEAIDLVDLSQTELQIPGMSAVWSSDAGLNIGTADGQLIVVTEKKLIYSTGTTGATVVDKHNVINVVA